VDLEQEMLGFSEETHTKFSGLFAQVLAMLEGVDFHRLRMSDYDA
jgi:hypothetical protein